MHTPVCVKCHRTMRVHKAGVVAHELRTDVFKGTKSEKAKALLSDNVDYKIWHCDIYKCPVCGIEIIGAFADKPISEHYGKDFKVYKSKVEIEFY